MKQTLICLAIVALLVSCAKESVEPELAFEADELTSIIVKKDNELKTKKARSQFLTSKNGKAWIIYKQLNNDVDVTAFVRPCDLDNILIFYPNGKYLQTPGATKCDSLETDVYDSGTWDIPNDTTISLKAIRFNTDVKVLELKPNSLIVSFPFAGFGIVTFYLRPVWCKN